MAAPDAHLPELEQHPTDWQPEQAEARARKQISLKRRLPPCKLTHAPAPLLCMQVTLNVTLDAAFVPSETQGALQEAPLPPVQPPAPNAFAVHVCMHAGTRLDFAHLVVLDNFITEADRRELLDFLTAPQWQGPVSLAARESLLPARRGVNTEG